MRKPRAGIGALAVLCGVLAGAGCVPSAAVPPRGEPSAGAGRAWRVLFDGKAMTGWRVLQGAVTCGGGAMVLDGRERDVTILAVGLDLKNGTLELEVRRQNPAQNAGPYTIALRLPWRLTWRSVYFVCRPDYLEACAASWRNRWPDAEHKVNVERTDQPEIWRFVLDDGLIECYRFGRKILSYVDAEPCGGAIAMTASKCRVEVLRVRWLPAGDAP